MNGRRQSFGAFLGALLAVCAAARGAEPSAEGIEFFEKRVRPVLVENCVGCHGEKKQKSGLRLDHIDHVMKGGEGGAVLVPGQPDKSRLIEAVRWTNPDLQMPEKKKLADADVEALVQWVRMGAPWPAEKPGATAAEGEFDLEQRKARHWAWTPIRRPATPAVKDASWPRNGIDRFILAKLEEKGLKPAAEAERRIWIRRVYFDLIGLPPSPEEMEAFVGDPSSSAHEKVVDRLLGSEHFGERWGRHWLDLVRYAETRGHEFDPLIPGAWQYRDYVVRALNADLPYDQFVREHIAGDLLEKPRLHPAKGWNESVLGTGFWFLGEELHSPVDIRQDEMDRLDNRLDTMSKAFLGLTVACARCHDHKFDAISQKDYYALMGFLQSSTYRQVRFETMERERRVAEELQRANREHQRQVLDALANVLRTGSEKAADHLAAAKPQPAPLPEVNGRVIVDYSSDIAPWYSDGVTFGLGPARAGDVLWGENEAAPIRGIVTRGSAQRESLLSSIKAAGAEKDHGTLGGWDRAGRTIRTPRIVLSSGKLWYLVRGAGRAYAAVDSHLNVAGPLHGALLKEWKPDAAGWRWVSHDLSAYAGHRGHVEFTPAGEGDFALAMVVEEEGQKTGRQGDRETRRGREEWRKVLESAAAAMEKGAKLSPDEANAADWAVRHLDVFADSSSPSRRNLTELAARVVRHRRELVEALAATSHTAPAMWEGNGVDEWLLKRGSVRMSGDVVPRRFLEALGGAPHGGYGAGSGRLTLAEQILNPGNPFTARVMVNRVWHHLFGTGIVRSVDNFGVLGEPPSHPELLDYLAEEFRTEMGWSLKALIRRVVLSSTYRMSSRIDPAAEQADPQNRLLHRMPVRRLQAEAIRDAILAVSGKLDRKVGGPSVEVHLTEFMDGRGKPASSGPLDGAGRRSIYIRVRRNFLPPMMLAFDMPIPFQAMGRRNVSNVPAQALIMMNDPFVAGQARAWAERGSGKKAEERVERMYLEAFGRRPADSEMRDALAFIGEAGNDERAWADLAHVLLNAKELILVR